MIGRMRQIGGIWFLAAQLLILCACGASRGASMNSLRITPGFISMYSTENVFTVTLIQGGEFKKRIHEEDIQLSNAFQDLKVKRVVRMDAQTLEITLEGKPRQGQDYGYITIDQSAIDNGNTVSKSARGRVSVGRPSIESLGMNKVRSDNQVSRHYSYYVRGGSWSPDITLKDIKIQGALSQSRKVELFVEEDVLTLVFTDTMEKGEAVIEFASSASTLNENVRFTIEVS